jgi:hypothetical protein
VALAQNRAALHERALAASQGISQYHR